MCSVISSCSATELEPGAPRGQKEKGEACPGPLDKGEKGTGAKT